MKHIPRSQRHRHRTRRPDRLTAALLLVGAAATLAACGGDDDGGGASGHPVAVFEVAGRETYRIELTTPELEAHARALYDGEDVAAIPNGVVVRDSPGVNGPWSWHIDSSTLEFADMTTEVCDGLPSDVEEGLITSDRYCPWLTQVIAIED